MAEQFGQDTQSAGRALATRGVIAQPAKRTTTARVYRSTELQVALVADFNRRFPGEALTLFVRLLPRMDLAGCGLEVRIPDGLAFSNCSRLCGDGPAGPLARHLDGDLYATFDFVDGLAAGEVYEYALHTVIEPAEADRTLDVVAVALARAGADGPVIRDEEALALSISAKSNYVRYLPSLYTRDELMGRFLMLFESFHAPISQQIRQIPYIFDPSVTPTDMLPWLASWLDLSLDPAWPESQRRALLKAARRLYQKRGTAAGLQEYLEIYTGGEVQIIEHRADNFVVRSRADLGNSIALGRGNRPHAFTVIVRLRPEVRGDGALDQEWQRRIAAIIDKEKPVHTTYTLHIETLQDQPG